MVSKPFHDRFKAVYGRFQTVTQLLQNRYTNILNSFETIPRSFQGGVTAISTAFHTRFITIPKYFPGRVANVL